MSTNNDKPQPVDDQIYPIIPGQIWLENSRTLWAVLEIESINSGTPNAPKERAVLLNINKPKAERRIITEYWDRTFEIWYDPISDEPPTEKDFETLKGDTKTEVSILGGHAA